jgi:UMF1 family MFS transporter
MRLDKGQVAWAFFDWATQPYFTLILTFIFGPYFATRLAENAVSGQALWGYLQAVAGLLIAFSSPVFGAIADRAGRRKLWCGAFAGLGCIGACGLWLAAPGAPALLAGGMMIVATVGFEVATVFNNALLPGLTSEGGEGWLSGFGWGNG